MPIVHTFNDARGFVGLAGAQIGAANASRTQQQRDEELALHAQLQLLQLAEGQRRFDLGLEANANNQVHADQRYSDQFAYNAMRDRSQLASAAANREAQRQYSLLKDQQDFQQQAALTGFQQQQYGARQEDQQAALAGRLGMRLAANDVDAMESSINDALSQLQQSDLTPEGQAMRNRMIARATAVRGQRRTLRPDAYAEALAQVMEDVQDQNWEHLTTPKQPTIQERLDGGEIYGELPPNAIVHADRSGALKVTIPPDKDDAKKSRFRVTDGVDMEWTDYSKLRKQAHDELRAEKGDRAYEQVDVKDANGKVTGQKWEATKPDEITDDEITARMAKIAGGHQPVDAEGQPQTSASEGDGTEESPYTLPAGWQSNPQAAAWLRSLPVGSVIIDENGQKQVKQ